MSNNNVISEKKKALLAYKEKILNDIKYFEKSIDDVRANNNKNIFYDDHADSSDSEDDFPSAIDTGPSITQLKQQHAMLKTCLQATQELTGLTILQSEVDVLVDEPKFEGEPSVTEPGTWREVIAECRIDLITFTITFFMHTPERKFGPPSYRGLRVVPIKPAHELELSKSVLHSLKLPSDAVEVLRSYAAGYRSRRTTLARLANKYTNALFMEPHPEGGFVMKCADLLEVSWRLENKWSPVAPFHHRMKFDLEFMEESYIKIIAQAHKQLLDPSIQTDERTLLLAKIIATCIEARGPIDPGSDLESKTTERDNDIDKQDGESEKRDSEVMAPPKTVPKKVKQKSKDANTAQKRSLDDENGDSGAKKMRNDETEAKKTNVDANNPRKSKISDVATEGGKKRKLAEVNKVASAKNAKESGNIDDGGVNFKDNNVEDKTASAKPKNTKLTENNAKTKNLKEAEEKSANSNSKPKNMKESVSKDDKIISTKTKNKITPEAGDTATKGVNAKSKTKNVKEPEKSNNNLKEPGNVLKETANIDSVAKPKTKIDKDIGNKNQEKNDNNQIKENNSKDIDKNKVSATKNNPGKESNTEKVKNNVNKAKIVPTKETGNSEENNQNENIVKTKSIEKNKPKTIASTKSKENIDANKDAGRPKSKISEKTANNVKNVESNTKKNDNKTKNTEPSKSKSAANTKNDNQATKKITDSNTNVANPKNPKDEPPKKVLEKKNTNKEIKNDIANKAAEKNIKEKTSNTNVKNVTQIVKKVTEKNATITRSADKISPRVSEQIIKEKPVPLKEVPEKVLNTNLTSKKTKDLTKNTKTIIKKPIIAKIASHRNSLKPQNPPKIVKAGNTKAINTGNTEKENGGKGSKIPQKKLSIISEGSSKKNMLRISPRKVPSTFKTTTQDKFKHKMVKSTNIPRLLKKPAPKTT